MRPPLEYKKCEYRHPDNGNCMIVGGFCGAHDDNTCVEHMLQAVAIMQAELRVAEKKVEKYAENLSETMHKAYEIFAENEVLRAIAESCGFDVRLVNKEASEEHGEKEREDDV